MAKKRMFSLDVVDTDLFLEMPVSTQNLYFHLSMRADDDGFISSPNKIMKMTNSSKNDMDILILKSFIIPFDSGICVIRHRRINNYLRGDRYTPTIHKEELSVLSLQDEVYSRNTAQNSHGIPTGLPMGDTGKNSIDKNSKEDNKKSKNKTPFVPPTLYDVISYFKENGYKEEIAKKAFNIYNVADWYDTKGNKIKVRKQKMHSVWFTEQNKAPKEIPKDNSHIQNIYDLSHLQGQI